MLMTSQKKKEKKRRKIKSVSFFSNAQPLGTLSFPISCFILSTENKKKGNILEFLSGFFLQNKSQKVRREEERRVFIFLQLWTVYMYTMV
jgi:succinate-acetate transporter protein